MSLMRKGRFSLRMASARHSSKVATGAHEIELGSDVPEAAGQPLGSARHNLLIVTRDHHRRVVARLVGPGVPNPDTSVDHTFLGGGEQQRLQPDPHFVEA
jgi:hypothetical protein